MQTTMLFRPVLWAGLALAGLGFVTAAASSFGPTSARIQARGQTDRDGRQVSLYDQLRVGLKAYTKADLAFIELVVQKVEQGKLPRKMVDGTFLWARNRYKDKPGAHRLRPIVYFQPALTAQAKKIGVAL
ncbi:MAG: hypothetical protein IT424_02810 [Pirellulales bacterium]|nr:hypothetical protein [Pirellulales bacterium]